MIQIGCWCFTGTPTQNGVVTVGNSGTTPLHLDYSRRIHEVELESDKRDYSAARPEITVSEEIDAPPSEYFGHMFG